MYLVHILTKIEFATPIYMLTKIEFMKLFNHFAGGIVKFRDLS
jgi:hypothetical protein